MNSGRVLRPNPSAMLGNRRCRGAYLIAVFEIRANGLALSKTDNPFAQFTCQRPGCQFLVMLDAHVELRCICRTR